MIGNRKPAPEFVVAPRMVMASPTLGIAIDTAKHTAVNAKVTIAFYLVFILVSGGKNISSIESLQGNRVNGVASRTTTIIPKRQIYITVFCP